jgi:hypothetical protein
LIAMSIRRIMFFILDPQLRITISRALALTICSA